MRVWPIKVNGSGGCSAHFSVTTLLFVAMLSTAAVGDLGFMVNGSYSPMNFWLIIHG